MTPFNFACAVCFGDPNGKLHKGLDLAVFFLVGVIGFVLTAIVAVTIVWARRAAKLAKHIPDPQA